MKKRTLFLLRFAVVASFCALSFYIFKLFYAHARLATPEQTNLIYLLLALYIFCVYASFFLFPRSVFSLFATLSLIPSIMAFIGLGGVWPLVTGGGVLLVSVFLFSVERKKRQMDTSVQTRMDDTETRCNEYLEEIETLVQKRGSFKKKQDRFSLLQEALRGLSFTSSEPDLGNQCVVRACALAEKATAAVLHLLQEDNQHLDQIARSDLHRQDLLSPSWLEPFHQWVMRHRQPLLVVDVQKEFRFEIPSAYLKQPEFPQSLIVIPLISEDKILGMLTLYGETEKAFSIEELRLLSILSSHTALSYANGRLYREKEKLANRDGLTHLYVQRYFKEKLEAELLHQKKSPPSFAVMMMDVDLFKKVNDTHGHLVGDTVLTHLAQILHKYSPQDAVLCRYGGEEFALMLPGYSKKEAQNLAETLREEVAQTKLPIRRKEIQVTLSIGISHFPEDGLLQEELLQKADAALYKAKQAGRNKVICV